MPLIRSWVVDHRNDIDIFCFQEVRSAPMHRGKLDAREHPVDIFEQLKALLPDHDARFSRSTTLRQSEPQFAVGLAMFVRKNIKITSSTEVFVHGEQDRDVHLSGDMITIPRQLQYALIECPNKRTLMVCNFHGLWNGAGKTDTSERVLQSEKLKNFLTYFSTPMFVCGDFNLEPDTGSLALIKGNDLHDLIAEYGVTSTRTSYYQKPERFADYVFVCKVLRPHVMDFRVLPDEVSDHSPLLTTMEFQEG